jgi:hypothetical protein
MVDGRAARVSVMGGIGAEEEESPARVRAGVFIGRRRVPRHDADEGEGASEGEKENTASRWPPVHGGDEDELVLEFL